MGNQQNVEFTLTGTAARCREICNYFLEMQGGGMAVYGCLLVNGYHPFLGARYKDVAIVDFDAYAAHEEVSLYLEDGGADAAIVESDDFEGFMKEFFTDLAAKYPDVRLEGSFSEYMASLSEYICDYSFESPAGDSECTFSGYTTSENESVEDWLSCDW